MDTTPPPPPSFGQPVSPLSAQELNKPSSTKKWVIITIIAALLVLLLALLASQQGAYLQTRVLNQQVINEESSELAGLPASELDEYTKIEAYCAQAKQHYIEECGYGYPEDDYECRTAGANQAFQDCVNSTTIEDIEDLESTNGNVTGEDDGLGLPGVTEDNL